MMTFYKAVSRSVTRPSLDELRQVARFSRTVHSYHKSDSVKLYGKDSAVRCYVE